MSELNLYRINNFYSPKRKARNIRRCSGLRIFTERVYTKNTPRSPCGERGAKTKLVFTAARSLQSRSYAAGGARYLQSRPYAFKDPRGRFGISYPAAVLRTEQSTAREVKSDRTRMANAVLQHITCMDGCVSPLRTAALRSNRRYGAAALLHCGAKVPQISASKAQKNAYLYRSTRRVRCS